MPELPEVETTCRGIQPFIVKQTITNVKLYRQRLRWDIPKPVATLQQANILNVSRRAKYILIQTSKGTLLIHLGMTGRLNVVPQELPREKHDHVDFRFSNGTCLRYTDPRRFGSVLWADGDPLEHALLASLGLEPLSRTFTGKRLFALLQNRATKIKQALMDQKLVVGVGNIYVSEALFLAQVLPTRVSHTITEAECVDLVQSIKQILRKAIAKGGTTLKDFVGPGNQKGYFIQQLHVYGRAGEPCHFCETLIENSVLGQRSTFFCGGCQR